LRALKTLPLVSTYQGNFLAKAVWAGLVHPVEYRPRAWIRLQYPRPAVAKVWKTEEKGSDVNLGSHLVRDAFLKKFDTAAVLTNDTDLVEPIRIVTQEVKLPVILLSPVKGKPAASLAKYATSVRHIRPYLGPSQFPATITDGRGRQIRKPPGW
jgi:hypothetical protein